MADARPGGDGAGAGDTASGAGRWRYAICNELFEGWDFGRTCDFVARTGYQGIELAPFTVAAAGADRLGSGERVALRRRARDAGLEVVGLHWLLVGPTGLHLTTADPAVRARTARYLISLAECCADLGGRVLVLGSPRQRNLDPGVPLAEGMQRAALCLEPAVRRAESLGVRWSLEPLPATDTNFLNTLEEALSLDRRLGGGPGLGVQLDVKSLCAEGVDARQPAQVILAHAEAADRFVHLHANDRNLGGPGSGDVDFRPIFASLYAVHYTGWVSVEVFDFRAGAERIASDSLAYLHRAAASA